MNYDVIIIGAGPGGYVAAIKAAQFGAHVLIVEKDKVGGTCLNRGCIPTKTYMHLAHEVINIPNYEHMGLSFKEVMLDFDRLSLRKDEVVSKMVSGVEGLLKGNKVTLIKGEAKVISSKEVVINGEKFTCDKVIIATGSKPVKLPIVGIDLDRVLTSDEVLDNPIVKYEKLVIIGGGVIGVEFATIYNAFGCDVTIIEAADRLLPNFDIDISQNLNMILKKRGVKIFTKAKLEKVTKTENSVISEFIYKDKKEYVESDAIIVSVGRQPDLKDVIGGELSIATDRGYIVVDENFQTSVNGIYAIGDIVKGSIQLAHMASAQGIHAICSMFGKHTEIDLKIVPSCVYTSPEIACVGITADEAKTNGVEVKIGKALMSANGKSIIDLADRGFVKVVFDKKTDEIIGAQVMCNRATDMIGALAMAISNKLKLTDMTKVIHAHPTFYEAVQEALEDVSEQAIHMMPRSK